MGVASDSLGVLLAARLKRGISGGCESSGLTGLAFGEGGMPRVRRGVRLPLWLRPPGTGGRRSGTGEVMVRRLRDADGGRLCQWSRFTGVVNQP